MNRSDVLAYLVVLNHPPVMQELSQVDIWNGQLNTEGCLLRVLDQLEAEDPYLFQQVKRREKLNNRNEPNDSELLLTTAECANLLYQMWLEIPVEERPYCWAR